MKINVLIPSAIDDEIFIEQTAAYAKNLYEINGKPLIEHVFSRISSITNANYSFILKRNEVEKYYTSAVIRLLNKDCNIFTTNGMCKGAACTALLAVDQINSDDPLVIYNGDIIINQDINSIVQKFINLGYDGGIVTFPSIHPRWSYVQLNSDMFVIEVAEKKPISKHATAGLYYFRKGRYFVESAYSMIKKDAHVNDNYYICPAYNELILRQKQIGIHEINYEDYFTLSTLKDIRRYEDLCLGDGNK